MNCKRQHADRRVSGSLGHIKKTYINIARSERTQSCSQCLLDLLKKRISRKPASLEAWLEVFRMERPKGVVWAPPGSNPFFSLFRVHFLEPRLLRKQCFLQGNINILRSILGPKRVRSAGTFFILFGVPGLWLHDEHLGVILGSSWAVLGPSWAVLGPSWAVLGPSWAVLGPSWAVLGLQ
jgi:hypothetical protein